MPLLIITGGSGYVGGAIAALFASKGWQVVSLSRTGNAPAGGEGLVCDIMDAAAVSGAVDDIVARFGNISLCLHAAAGALERVPLLETSDASALAAISTTYLGALHLAKAVIPHMTRGGAFIGITSQAMEPGTVSNNMGAYVPAKSALRGFLRALAADPKARDIRVHAVAPGFLPGGLNADLPKLVHEVIAKRGGASSSQDVAALVLRLMEEPNAFPAGTSIRVPSGETSPL